MHTPQVTCTTIIAAVIAAWRSRLPPAAARACAPGPPELDLRDGDRNGRKRREWRRRARRFWQGLGGVLVDWLRTSSPPTPIPRPLTRPPYPRSTCGAPIAGTTVLASATATGEMANADSTGPRCRWTAGPRRVPVGRQRTSTRQGAARSRSTPTSRTSNGHGDPGLEFEQGERANGPTSDVALSGDGQAVAFVSTATNLDPRDTDTAPDVYVKNLATGAVTLASIAPDGNKPAGTRRARHLAVRRRKTARVQHRRRARRRRDRVREARST